MYEAILKTPIGFIGIRCLNAKLSAIHFLEPPIVPLPSAKFSEKVSLLTKKIEAFFSRAQSLLDVPYTLQGTDFQKSVWRAMRKIPLGETRTYGELAIHLGTSPRAIGMACRTNPLPLIIPCHRVVSATGLGGFCGQRHKVTIKNWLLAHERPSC